VPTSTNAVIRNDAYMRQNLKTLVQKVKNGVILETMAAMELDVDDAITVLKLQNEQYLMKRKRSALMIVLVNLPR